jgi:peptide/nickel transport system permease protein
MTRFQAAGVRVARPGGRTARWAQRGAGGALLALVTAAAVFAPILALNDPTEQHEAFPYAPPMPPHVFDDDWELHAPFVYAIHLADRLQRTYLQDRSDLIPLFVKPEGASLKPVFLLGTDALGRDLFSRLLYGARASLGIALVATALAILIGVLLGGVAGFAGGVADEATMRAADLVLVLPAIYVVLTLRAAMPLVLATWQVFVGVSIVLALVGWPLVARAVRAIVATERTRDYTEAARAAGASPARVLFVHVLPATGGAVATQAALLVPAFVLAEATLSFVGFGFAEPTPSWGTLLQEAGSVRVFGDYPWLLAPAAAIAIVSLSVNLLISESCTRDTPVQF